MAPIYEQYSTILGVIGKPLADMRETVSYFFKLAKVLRLRAINFTAIDWHVIAETDSR